ncbi:hypothetical protein ACQ4PT_015355 [Festuca glaucescens]
MADAAPPPSSVRLTFFSSSSRHGAVSLHPSLIACAVADVPLTSTNSTLRTSTASVYDSGTKKPPSQMNMDGQGPGDEESEEYRLVVSKTFRSEDEGYEFYNEYAKVKGFSIRKEEVKYLPGTHTRFRRLYTCFKEGYRTLANFEKPEPKKTPKALTRCGCRARLEIELSAATGEWFVKNFEDKHNHPLAKEGQSAYLFSHRRMTDGQKADVVGYGIGGLRTHKIMDVMEHQAGGPDKVVCDLKQKVLLCRLPKVVVFPTCDDSGKILCPTTGVTVNSKYLSLVDSVQKVRSINWAKLTLDHLVESIASFKLGKANLEGNLVLLQLWYWEKLRFNNMDPTIDYSEREIPLMQYWTEQKARKVDRIDERCNFAAGMLVEDYMKPTPPRKKLSKPAAVPHVNMPAQYPEQLEERLDDISTSIMENRGLSKIEYDHLVRESQQTRNEVRRVDINLRYVMLHLGVKYTELDNTNNKFGENLSMNLEKCYEADKSQYSMKRKKDIAAETSKADKSEPSPKKNKGGAQQSGTIGQRLRGPSGRKPTPSRKKDDYYYPGSTSNAKSDANASDPNQSSSHWYETMSQRDKRREWEGRVKITTVKTAERQEEEEIIDWVNTTKDNISMVQIDGFTISQRHLACLTNPYLEDVDKYLGDEVIDAWIEHYKRSNPQDVREDGSIFIERVINTMALEMDGRKNAPVRLRMGGSRKGLDFITNQLIFLPIHMKSRQHWFLGSVNTNMQYIQLRGMESHIEYALQQHGRDICTWAAHPERNFHVASWPIEMITSVPQQRDSTSCGLYLIMNMLNWNGRWLTNQWDQAYVNYFRPKLAVTLIKSPHNSEKKGPKKTIAISSEI